MLVFVYGTLRRGQPNNRTLGDSPRRHVHCIVRDYAMVSLGPFPAAYKCKGSTIVGEIYEVTEETLKRLDRLEGYPDFYKRQLVETGIGKCWIYYRLARECKGGLIIKSGDWCGRN